ncbi:hypothetical protein [Actinorhabdospora filicis]|nr:hypothetical protein [Actinorhabdospora filicis]
MRRERAAVRLLLLVAVVLGLGWMHTLGHQAHEPGGHSTHLAVDDGPAVAPGAPMSPDTEMCLAVLAATVLLAAGLLTAHVRRDPATATPHSAVAPTGRGPPRVRPSSLLYADLTVLRI